jgi:hypothetical protein
MRPLRECTKRRLDDEMVVIRHQTVLVQTPAESFDRRGEQGKKQELVVIVSEDVLPFVASGCDVPEGTFEFKSERS